MKNLLYFFVLLFPIAVPAQPVCNELYHHKFSKQEVAADIDYMYEKIKNAHINPYTGITQEEFAKKISTVKAALKDSMTQRDFYFAAAPIMVSLNDEHSGMNDYCVTDSIKNNFKVFPLRFEYENDKIILTENYSPHDLTPGDELISLNGIAAADLAENCARLVPGPPDESKPIAIERLWMYLPKFCYFIEDNYQLLFRSGKQVLVKSQPWDEFRQNYSKTNPVKKSNPLMQYEKVEDAGYLTVNSFSINSKLTGEVWDGKLDSIFTLIKRDKVKRLFIDVSNNGGGNSAVGRKLIDYFSGKPYRTYSGKWKKSAEYVDYMKRNGLFDSKYEKLADGTVMEMPQEKIIPKKKANRFKGITYIVVGKHTFSSAIMFAAIVQDNKLAKLVGETPRKGHPNHFGELVVFSTPNTQLNFAFGVKEWIRPAGKSAFNKLVPDIPFVLNGKTPAQIIAGIK
ncbi:S41 family peptidase [Flavobacterium sp. MFBS3-15]|uniref:S41 family peptidase n=1 Tax=Flavobacterium sp. MFBS3-15 TaxID=2989816 RepID=UPI0022354A18|nr:S41 family peptidase [Flavobacterium sp. MFBS3-15]MCW4468198.1 S41 family peptidase [Flavobacterium sp. MFBS3-15]